jgi:hypothetical protein
LPLLACTESKNLTHTSTHTESENELAQYVVFRLTQVHTNMEFGLSEWSCQMHILTNLHRLALSTRFFTQMLMKRESSFNIHFFLTRLSEDAYLLFEASSITWREIECMCLSGTKMYTLICIRMWLSM